MTATLLSKPATIGEAYEQVKKLLYSMCHLMARRRGGRGYEELLSQAHESFCKAYRVFNEEKGRPFPSWVAFVVRCELRTMCSREIKVRDKESAELPDEVAAKPGFNLNTFLLEVEDDSDCALAVREALTPSLDTIINARCIRDERSPATLKQAIREYLQDQGWDNVRIHQCFDKVRRLLEEHS